MQCITRRRAYLAIQATIFFTLCTSFTVSHNMAFFLYTSLFNLHYDSTYPKDFSPVQRLRYIFEQKRKERIVAMVRWKFVSALYCQLGTKT